LLLKFGRLTNVAG